MHSVADSVEKTESVLLFQKEQALKAALDHYFKGGWTEEDVAELAVMECHHDGVEIFKINGQEMLKFGAIKQYVDVDGSKVICRFSQSIEVLYDN